MRVEPNWDSCVKDTWEPGYRFPKILEHFLKIIRRSYERFLSISRNLQMNSENCRQFPISYRFSISVAWENSQRFARSPLELSQTDVKRRLKWWPRETSAVFSGYNLGHWNSSFLIGSPHTDYQRITLLFFLIRALGALSSAAAFKSFLREAKVLSKNMTKKTATITEVEKLLKQLYHSHLLGIRLGALSLSAQG